MATITINYTANYLGDHRVCYRQVGTTNYCCLTDTVSALGPQTFIIDFAVLADFCDGTADEVVVPVETDCGPYSYEGYIQPDCEVLGSPNNRTLWTADFTTTPSCLAYIITCESAGVASITVTEPDGGMVAVPGVTITGGGGAGATAIALMRTYTAGISISAAGAGYIVGEQVFITGGTGSGIQLQVATLGGGGSIATFIVISEGLYSVLPGTVGVASTASGAGAGATFDILYSLAAVTVTAPGDDYTSAPTIGFTGAAPAVPEAFALLLPCNDFTTPSCGATATVGLEIGQSAVFCDTTGTPVMADDGYNVVADPAVTCCGCSEITAVALGSGEVIPYIYYTDAVTHDVVYLDNGGAGYMTTTPGSQILLGPLGDQPSVEAIPNSWGAAPGYNSNFVVIAVACS